MAGAVQNGSHIASTKGRTAMPLLMCPNCNASMTEVKRQDVAFDMCPTCRGVWLDRGELEKIIAASREDRAEFQGGAPYPQDQQRPAPQHGYGERGERGEQGERGYSQQGYGQQGYSQHGRRKRGFDLFDIFD
jgi:uncharacterized protein